MAFEDWAYPPDKGGRWKIVLLGIVLPLFIAYWAGDVWVHQKAIWPGRGGVNLTVKGDTARAVAVCYLSGAGFCHFRWYWGLVSSYVVFVRGTVISLSVGLVGFLAAVFFLFRQWGFLDEGDLLNGYWTKKPAQICWRGLWLIALCAISGAFSLCLILAYWDYGQRFAHLPLSGGAAFSVYAGLTFLSLMNGVVGLVACLVVVWHLFDKRFLYLWRYYLISLTFLSPWIYLLCRFVCRSLARSVV